MIKPVPLSMLTPLDAVQRDPLLYQFPQWTEFSQERYPLLDSFQNVVNLAFGGEPANAKSNATVRTLVATTQCSQDIARLERGGRASASRR